MKRSRIVLVINALIVISVLSCVAVLALIGVGGMSSVSSFSIGTPTTSTSGSVTTLQVPITIGNSGYFSYSGIDVQITVKDAAGDQLLTGGLGPFDVPPGQTKHVDASFTLDTSNLPQSTLQRLATNSENLTVSATLAASEPPFLGISGAVSAPLKWGAPVSGLNVGAPIFSQHNSTTVEAAVPVSFSNQNQFITISGDGVVKVLNSSNQEVGGGRVTLDVPPGGEFNQQVVLFVKLTHSQLQSLMTTDQSLSYTAVLSLPNGALGGFSLNRPISYQWGAPFSGLAVGSFATSPHNATYSQISTPFSFKDNSAFIGVSGSVGGTITDQAGNVVGRISPSSVNVAPGQTFSGTLTGYVQNLALGQSSYVLHLTFDTPFGTFAKLVTVNV